MKWIQRYKGVIVEVICFLFILLFVYAAVDIPPQSLPLFRPKVYHRFRSNVYHWFRSIVYQDDQDKDLRFFLSIRIFEDGTTLFIG